jgi:hypothetical protein
MHFLANLISYMLPIQLFKASGGSPPPTVNALLLTDGSFFLLTDGTDFLLAN